MVFMGKYFIVEGVRQGDPLSPLLFVMATDLVQSILNKAKDLGVLRLPIDVGYTRLSYNSFCI
jgi:hypothetical protein